MKTLVYMLGVLLFLSCSNEVEVETVSLEEILPQSTYSNNSEEKDTIASPSVSEFQLNLMRADTTLDFSFSAFNVKLFPDRLTSISREQELIVIGADSIVLTVWEYSDSLTTINAFYNWLDCFGDNCTEVRIGEEVNFSKKNVLTLVSDHHLVYAESTSGFDMKMWLNNIFPAAYPEDLWFFGITQPARRKGRWHILGE